MGLLGQRFRSSVRVNVAVKESPGATSGVVPSTSAFVGAAIGSNATNGLPGGTHTCTHG